MDLDLELDPKREQQYDLLTAAVIGAAVGAGIALLVRRGPGGSRPIKPLALAAGRGARWAGARGLEGARWAGDSLEPAAKWAGRGARRGGRWAREQGSELLEQLPAIDDVTDSVRDYLEVAREAINETVENEVKGLRKAIRRQRKRVGI